MLFWLFVYADALVVQLRGREKSPLRTLDPITLVCFRLELAAIVLLPIYFRAAQSQPAAPADDIWPFACLGFFGVIVNQGLFTVGPSISRRLTIPP